VEIGEGEADIAAAGRHDHRVLCLPASDEADAITAAMLSQIVQREGYPVVCVPVTDSISDSMAELAGILPQPGDIVVISALPPFALLKARTMSKQLHAQFPDVKVIVGLWNFSGSGSVAERFGRAFVDTVVTTLSDAMVQIRAFSEGVPQAQEAQLSNVPGDAKNHQLVMDRVATDVRALDSR
jgi:hypothetical protein